MKRFHVHLSVQDLEQNIQFYSILFGQEPSRQEADYAKWMLDDPRVNFAVSARGGATGIDHLGIQTEDRDELAEVYDRLSRAGADTLEEGETTCCYARSEKSWVADPVGTSWEVFRTLGESTDYGHDRADMPAETSAETSADTPADSGACCTPKAQPPAAKTACCSPDRPAS